MSVLSNSAQMILKTGLSLAGVLGLAALVASPASAESAIRGSVSEVTPAGFVTTVSGEAVLPEGLYYPGAGGDYVFTGDFTTAGVPVLTINGGEPTVVPVATAGTTIKQAVIAELDGLDPATRPGLDAYAAILKAAAGADGLE
ncbi:MAG: hypothetical protein KME10_13410 [Plectolyngbya sp. WJT66-NPBG17]|jgi:hypothetical protein|nr:hypothetical protein [Plectolyngbya sp. WJT66-NPBG17]MBW4525892.1 hypothetical protein [Phormidium tanganyikae FI6-MK23]